MRELCGGFPVSLVFQRRPRGRSVAARASCAVPGEAEYQFLLGRFVDRPTLSCACAVAQQWGVNPHDVLIANGWISQDDYYRALAETTGVDFKATVTPHSVVPPAGSNPQQCLARGLLLERGRSQRLVFAPSHLRPNMLQAVISQLGSKGVSLATPRAVKDVVYRHFAPALSRGAVDTLATRRPDLSARGGLVPWQRVILLVGLLAFAAALALAPAESIRGLALLLAILFVPVIGLRALAALGLLRNRNSREARAANRAPDASLPTYTILAPLYGEAHMLPSLVAALTKLGWPVLRSKGTKEQNASIGQRLSGIT